MSAGENITPLARVLLAKGWTHLQVAAAAGVSTDSIRNLVRLNVAGMRLGTLVRVAQAVGLSCADLVPGLAAPPRSGPSRRLPGVADSSPRKGSPILSKRLPVDGGPDVRYGSAITNKGRNGPGGMTDETPQPETSSDRRRG